MNKGVYDGVICDNTVSVRRIAFNSPTPAGNFIGMHLNLLPYDDETLRLQGNLTTYLLDKSAWSNILWRKSKNPSNHFTAAFVTGHKLRFHFGKTGLNFENLNIEMSERWESWDKDIQFFHNFSDVRVAINMTVDGVQVVNDTIKSNPGLNELGHNYVHNDTDIEGGVPMMMSFVVNAK